MGFAVELWKLNKRDNSTMIPTADPITYQCITNTDFDVLSPEIPLNIGLTENPTSYNYAHIAVFNRYYWVTGWHVANGMWWVSLQVDVLASWRDDIGRQSLYVERSAVKYDGSVPDNTYNRTADFTITKVPFTLTNADQSPWKITGSVAGGSYVVGIVGQGGVINYWGFTYAQYQDLMAAVFNYDYGFQDEQLKASFNPIQYFTTIMWFPFSVAQSGTVEVEMGWWTITGSSGYKLGSNTYVSYGASVNLPKHPQQARGKWLNAADTTHYTLRLPCFGMLDVQGYDMIDATSINVEVNVDLPTGKATCMITPSSTGTATQVVDYQVGVTMPIAQLQSNILGMATNTLRNSGGDLGAMLSFGIVGAVQGVTGILGGIPKLGNISFGDKVSTSGGFGGLNDCTISGMLIASFQQIAPEDLPERGRPYCKRVQLNTLSGYMMITDPDVSIACTSGELSRIRAYLQGGFYYE